MAELAGHTIHKDHIHHGWNNAFAPCLRIAPGETIEFQTVDASSGQITRESTAADLERLDLARVNPVTGPVYIDGAEPGDALKVTRAVAAAIGLGLDGQHPRLRAAERSIPERPPASLELRPWPGAGDVRAWRPRAAAAVHRNDRRRACRSGAAQHHSAAQRGRQHGCTRHRRGRRAVLADRGAGRTLLRGRHTCGARRRRGLRHRDRKPDRCGAEVRTGEGRAAAHAALRGARPGDEPLRPQGLRGDHRDRPGPDGRAPAWPCPR